MWKNTCDGIPERYDDYWIWNGSYVIRAEWVPYRWHIGRGIVYNLDDITYYHAIEEPDINNGYWIPPDDDAGKPFSWVWAFNGETIVPARYLDGQWVHKTFLYVINMVSYQILRSPIPPGFQGSEMKPQQPKQQE